MEMSGLRWKEMGKRRQEMICKLEGTSRKTKEKIIFRWKM